MNAPPLLSVEHLTKSFPGVRALSNVSLALKSGEVLAVIGENGAGKSTLMKILAGVQTADSGRIMLDGQPVRLENARAAIAAGIVLIHQELNLCDNLNVGQNIFLGREPQKFGFVKSREINSRSQAYLQRVGLNVSARAIVSSLTIGKQQLVEIAKALSVDAKILILDEPTSSLSASESESLFRLIDDLRRQGVGIIYISHRLGEVRRLADRVLVLRDGENAGELGRHEITHDRMVSLMVGREIAQLYGRTEHPIGPTVLEVDSLVTTTWPQQSVSLRVRAGEIVGIAGLVGSGRTELLQTLFGVTPALSGSIRIAGQAMENMSPVTAVKCGLALVPEDRKQHGLLTDFSIRHNVGLAKLSYNRWAGIFANFSKQKAETGEMIRRLGIKTPSARQIAKFLSGGNQQKVVLGKWLALSPRILLLDEPTRGIDVGAKQEIYRLIEQLAAQSMAILFVSSELEEIMGLADRVLVMQEGRIAGELPRADFTEESILQMATTQ